MEYLDTIMENDDYIDTLQGKLPLAEAAKMISKDKSKREELFDKKHIRKTRIDCYKRLFIIGFSFQCLFASFFSLRNLQSSTSGDNPMLGFITFGCLAGLTWLGSTLANTVMYYTKPKWSLVIASMPFLLYPVSNFYPHAFTLIPCALLCGLGVGMIWSSEGTYMINLAATYAMVSKKPLMEVIGKFNGIVFTMQQSSHILGNLIISTLLSNKLNMFPKPIPETELVIPISEARNISVADHIALNTTFSCGLLYSAEDQDATGRFVGTDFRQLMVLYAVLVIVALIGSLTLAIFLRPLKTPKIPGSNNLCKNLTRFLRLFGTPEIWLLTPFLAYPGFSGSITVGDYTKAYITCAYGVGSIGYMLLAGACFSVLGAFTSGRVVHLSGRIPLFLFAALSSTGSMTIMRIWAPVDSHLSAVAFLPVCLGCLGDGIILTQLSGFLGEIFKSDLTYAISMLHLWYGIGMIFGTLSSAFKWFSITNKLYLAVSHAWISFLLLIILEIVIRRRKS